ncbi:MAG: SufD family Fe-S cluster assembly protein [bacterium]|nr:SufD family Fe-S cluster assembly protein [bacterium]
MEIDIQTAGENIQLFLSVIVIPDRFQPTKLHLQSNLLHSHTETNVHIISFLTDTTQAQIDGKVMVAPGIIKASGHLLEENIILGGKVKIQTLPMLDVRSNDVQASHGARIEKLDKKKLFYLQSRGLSDRAAKQLLISGYFETIF